MVWKWVHPFRKARNSSPESACSPKARIPPLVGLRSIGNHQIVEGGRGTTRSQRNGAPRLLLWLLQPDFSLLTVLHSHRRKLAAILARSEPE